MTRKQFDLETKRNLGDDIGGHTLQAYRHRMMRDSDAIDLLDSRARHGLGSWFKSRARSLIRSGHQILPGLAPTSCSGGQGLA
jgi:hypothetical protein